MKQNKFIRVLRKTYNKIIKLESEMYLSENHSSNLIFPIKNQPKQGEKERVSEQELRQCFISQLSKTDYYSIETPTKKKYKFTTDAKEYFHGSRIGFKTLFRTLNEDSPSNIDGLSDYEFQSGIYYSVNF